MIRRPVWSCMLLLPIRVLVVWPWARLLMSPSRWSPPTPPPIWMSALPMIRLLMLSTLIQPRSGWGDGDEVTAAIQIHAVEVTALLPSLHPAPSRCAAARSARSRKADEHERGEGRRKSGRLHAGRR